MHGRLIGGVVQEVVAFDPAERFAAPIAALFVTVPDDTQPGATANGDGTFTPPPAQPPYVPGPPPEPAPPPVPASVTNYQARSVMRTTILPDGVSLETLITTTLQAAKVAAAELPEGDPARIKADIAWLAYEQSNDFQRDGVLIHDLGLALGVTPEQIDALFIAAAEIPA